MQRPKLAVRVGIATGEVVVGEQIGIDSSREWSVVGDTPNLAARLQAAAKPGKVMVADSTRRLTREKFSWSEPNTLSLKGFDEPVRAWEVNEESNQARASALHPPRQRGWSVVRANWLSSTIGWSSLVPALVKLSC